MTLVEKKILVVEGNSDKDFFDALCANTGLEIEVKISTPKDGGQEKDGKLSALSLLDTLMPQLNDGRITHLAIVLDADYKADGWGYTQTLKKIKSIIEKYGYGDLDNSLSGLSFSHPDGLKSFGAWIMPDNGSEGMTEDWIKDAVISDESALLKHSIDVVKTVPQPVKFKNIHTCKAEIRTWLAWQKVPGQDLNWTIIDNLLDNSSPPYQGLTQWLVRIYTQ